MEVKRKKAQVIMLPTKDKIQGIYKGDNTGNLYYSINPNTMVASTPQHIYITSNEEIKIGDWVLDNRNSCNNFIHQVSTSVTGDVKKIIAATDESLNLPQPSQAFIKKFVELNGIDEVMVEYERKTFWIDEGRDSYSDLVLKVDKHNSISIHPIKNNFTKEELFEIVDRILIDYSDIVLADIPEDKLNNYFNI